MLRHCDASARSLGSDSVPGGSPALMPNASAAYFTALSLVMATRVLAAGRSFVSPHGS
jgi:hypothetical protein